jgi:hypothetical protein
MTAEKMAKQFAQVIVTKWRLRPFFARKLRGASRYRGREIGFSSRGTSSETPPSGRRLLSNTIMSCGGDNQLSKSRSIPGNDGKHLSAKDKAQLAKWSASFDISWIILRGCRSSGMRRPSSSAVFFSQCPSAKLPRRNRWGPLMPRLRRPVRSA